MPRPIITFPRGGLLFLPLLLFFFTSTTIITTTTAQPSSDTSDNFCPPALLSTCPTTTFIPYHDEFRSSFPLIEYCISPTQGYLAVSSQETCENLASGEWTVRPDFAVRMTSLNMTLEEQYVCVVCQAWNASQSTVVNNHTEEEGQQQQQQQVWILTLSNMHTYSAEDMVDWGSSLGVTLDQLVVSVSGQRYLFAFASYTLVHQLVRESPFVLAAQPLPAELKVSPRVVDPGSLNTMMGGDGNGNSDTTMAANTTAAATTTTTTLQVRTLISSSQEESGHLRMARHKEGLQRIHKALRLPPPPQDVPPEDVGVIVTHQSSSSSSSSSNNDGKNNTSSSSSSSSSPSSCENCTVEATGEGNYVISSIPFDATSEVALNVSHALPSAFIIDLAVEFKLFNKEASYLLQSGTNSTSPGGSRWLWDHGLTGEGEVVGVADTGLDYNSCFFHDSSHPVTFRTVYDGVVGGVVGLFQSEGHRKLREYYAYADASEGQVSGHGTHVSGSIAGDPAEMSAGSKAFQFRGGAYNAKLAFFDIGLPNDDMLYIPFNLGEAFWPRTYDVGGRIHSNSWGSIISDNSKEMYMTDAYLWQHQDFVILYAAGNEGGNAWTLGSPAAAKNSIAVGATSNNVATPDVAFFSSRGPTFDMRFGIDVVAPGWYVSSAYSQAAAGNSAKPNLCYIQGMAGTSMSTPLVAGTTALLREYFVKGFYPLGWADPTKQFAPMGALLKALLINSALRLNGTQATKHNTASLTWPNYDQGYGIVAAKYATYFQPSAATAAATAAAAAASGSGQQQQQQQQNVLFVDGMWTEGCAPVEGKSKGCPQLNQGESAYYNIIPTQQNANIKITLAWYDHPASVAISSKTLINDLDLTATQGTTNPKVYYANGGTSTGGANALNNVEQILIPNPTVGVPITIQVKGASVTMGPQPYALVVTGQFRKDFTLFNAAIPMAKSLAVDGDQVLLVGRNFPRSANHSQTFTWRCLSDTAVQIEAKVLSYSPATAQFLAVSLNTTACESLSLKIVSDGFIGNTTVLNYKRAPNISSYCAQVYADETCSGLSACAGQCLENGSSADAGGKYGGTKTLTTLIVVLVIGCVLLLFCGCLRRLKKAQRAQQLYNRSRPDDGSGGGGPPVGPIGRGRDRKKGNPGGGGDAVVMPMPSASQSPVGSPRSLSSVAAPLPPSSQAAAGGTKAYYT